MSEFYLGRLEVFPFMVHGGDLGPQLGYHNLVREGCNSNTLAIVWVPPKP